MKKTVTCACGRVYEFDLAVSTYKRCKTCKYRLAYVEHLINTEIEGYIIGQPICTGNHGTVFHIKDRPDIVMKIISEKVRATARVPVLTALKQRGINHPNLLSLLDFGLHNGFLWYTVPYCRGPKLNKTSAGTWKMSNKEKCRLVEELVGAPLLLQREGLIHRDMQESNMILLSDHIEIIDIDSISFEQEVYDPEILEQKRKHYYYRLVWILILMFSKMSFKRVTQLRKSKNDKAIKKFLSDQRFNPIQSLVEVGYNEEHCKIGSFKELKKKLRMLREEL